MSLGEISELKLDYNRLDGELRYRMVRGMRHSYLVDEYYERLHDPHEHDEVAVGFKAQYREAQEVSTDPEDIVWELEKYVHGNKLHHPRDLRATYVVLAHFFERCDIFDAPPHAWSPSGTEGK